jgi:phage terminase large subunit GpA-like protein
MDAFCDPAVETVVCMMSSQVGKTECLLNVIGYFADHEPAPQLVVQPTDAMAESFSKERVGPMFRDSPGLRGKLDEKLRKTSNTINVKHFPGGYLAFASSNTPAGLATRPIRVALFDEIDRYGYTREGDPVKLGIQRTQNFYNRKIGLVSTPTLKGSSQIEAWWEQSDKRLYWVPCLHCGHYQVLTWDSVKWEKNDKGESMPETAVIECQGCKEKIRERQRNEMVSRGEWRPENPKSKIRGYHISALYSPWVGFAALAAEWIKAVHDRDQKGMQEFVNLKLGRSWEQHRRHRAEDSIMALKDARPRGQVPGEGKVFCLTAAVDTQDNGFWYEVRAWGKGASLESWQIREGFIPALWSAIDPAALVDRQHMYHPTFDPLRAILFEQKYFDQEGNEFAPALVCIDAMGHKTTEVYDFCRWHRGKIFPVQGMRNRSNRPFKYSRIDTYPGTNKNIPGGLMLLQLDVHHFKDELSSRLMTAPLDPGAWHLHSETNIDWAAQMCAEHLDEKTNKWECPAGKENHAWDCSVYNLALAEVLQIRITSQQRGKQNEPDKKRDSQRAEKRVVGKRQRW